MSIKDLVMEQLKEAMKSRDSVRMNALRQIKSEVLKLETSGKPFTEKDVRATLKRLVNQHHESIVAFQKGGRNEKAEEEAAELKVIESFLPPPVSAQELEKLVKEAIDSLGASSPKDMGRVMKHLTSGDLEADGKVLSELVRKSLS